MTESNEPQFSQNMAEAQGVENTPAPSIRKRRQQARKELDQIARKDSDNLSMGEAERDIQRHGELVRELAKIEQLLEPMEVNEGDLRLNQEVYDKLGFRLKKGVRKKPIDLEQELRAGNILLPTKEQQELAEKEGLTQILIIPGQIKRQDFLGYFKGENYQNNFDSNDLDITDPAPKDLTKSEAIKNPKRPKQFYTILLSPQISCHTAHPETQKQSAQTCTDILAKKQNANSNLNLAGLTLEEYLLLDCLIYLKDNQKQHLEPKSWCWLLEEVASEGNVFIHCLRAFWGSGSRSVGVISGIFSRSNPEEGARFGAVPKQDSILNI